MLCSFAEQHQLHDTYLQALVESVAAGIESMYKIRQHLNNHAFDNVENIYRKIIAGASEMQSRSKVYRSFSVGNRLRLEAWKAFGQHFISEDKIEKAIDI
jgi:hypothetical protein